MNKGFFAKLAAGNIRKNSKMYIPYIITCVITVAVFYILRSLSINPGIEEMIGANSLSIIMAFGCVITGIFAVIFLFYTNSFLLKRRKKEFALFNILGMEKRHISLTLFIETLYVSLISIVGGIVLGIALDKLMFLLISRIIDAKVPLGFFISGEAIKTTVILFLVIFILIFLNAIRQVHMSDPIRLLQESSAGEKEPRTKWIMAVLGAACLILGYYLALSTVNPLAAFAIFFIAVILIVAGTYMLFTAGSVAFLKTLRKNKKFYYQTKHFISVSGMLYRMKQNAVGLANICILSTMVLVIVSCTSSLMIGVEDILTTLYGNDFSVSSYRYEPEESAEFFDEIKALQQEDGLDITEEYEFECLPFTAVQVEDGFELNPDDVLDSLFSYTCLFFFTLDDYNAAAGTDITLDDNEVLIYSHNTSFDYPTLKIFDREYTVKEKLDDFFCKNFSTAYAAYSQFIVVKDEAELKHISEELFKADSESGTINDIRSYYVFDTDADKEAQLQFYDDAKALKDSDGFNGNIGSQAAGRDSVLGLYGGFFFIGIFLGALFMMAAVLIIYYKQISEGYDDKERFEIMQKVGMSRREVKDSIKSQVLTVFFMPLIAAGCHVVATYPMMMRMMSLLNMVDTALYLKCYLVCFAVFTVLYIIIYMITAKSYYKIVSR